ncbi:MAG: S41 family peptidase [Patescibacteria group bacterium]|nr:S41 family peptidase [Patescibacteria group bacterium]
METNKKYKNIKKVVYIFGGIILLWLSFGAGLYFSGQERVLADLADEEAVFIGNVTGKYQESPEGRLIQDVNFEQFWEVWDTIYSTYVDRDKLEEKELFYGALRGMVSAVGDPYTVFMNPIIAKEFNDDLKGTFEGIGAEIGIKNDVLTIIAPLPDMPAEKAGLMAGDKVFAIDGEITAGISIDSAVNKIRGSKDTDVVLTIRRDGEEELFDITITRGQIFVKSINTKITEDNILSIKITNFNNDTERLFSEAVHEVLDNDVAGIIVDLRNNPGGYLDTAIEMASEWVDDKIVVVEKYSEERLIEHLARGRARLADFKTVVLVNQGSASASEIVSGALRDHEKAIIIGKKTFGKGSVQTLNKFADGSSIKITVAKWLTPNGRSINDDGIMPDYEVEFTRDDYDNFRDPQFDAAIEYLLGNDISAFLASSTEAIATSSEENSIKN